MRDDEFVIEKIPVYGRDESTHKLLGWTWGEMALMGIMVVLAQTLLHRRLLTIAIAVVTYLYIRRVKQYLPDRFVTNLCRHYLRRDTEYRAAGRDSLWRPPVLNE